MNSNRKYHFTPAQLSHLRRNIRVTGKHECSLWTGYVPGDGRPTCRAYEGHKRVRVRVHRAVFFLKRGYLPSLVHHICENQLCCNWRHLRDWSKQQHQAYHQRSRFERDREEFVRRWNSGELSGRTARQYAHRLRTLGYCVKRYRPGGIVGTTRTDLRTRLIGMN